MNFHVRFFLLIGLLFCSLLSPQDANGADAERSWQAYVLTGGEYADGGYRWLLLSQRSLQELATAEPEGQNQEVLAVWVLTHGRNKDWTAVRPLAVPPPITNYQEDKQVILVDSIEYKVETVPFSGTIPLLRKEQETALRSSIGPLFIRNRTARALKEFIDSETQRVDAAAAPTKLYVGSTFGGERSVINSTIADSDPRSGTLHGLQVTLGLEKRLRELAVYDNGFLVRRETFIEDGFELVHEQFNREPIPGGHGGNGYRAVWAKGLPGTRPATLAEGYLLDGKPWHGTFVFLESIPGDNSYEYPKRLVLCEYAEGKITTTKTEVTLGFGELEKDQTWFKSLPAVLTQQ